MDVLFWVVFGIGKQGRGGKRKKSSIESGEYDENFLMQSRKSNKL